MSTTDLSHSVVENYLRNWIVTWMTCLPDHGPEVRERCFQAIVTHAAKELSLAASIASLCQLNRDGPTPYFSILLSGPTADEPETLDELTLFFLKLLICLP